jgi:DNA-binding FadR family transcriptional regulator
MNGPFRPVDKLRAHEQIIVQVEDAIVEGRLRPGDRLPPERILAETLGVSRASLREALRVLESLGVLVARRGTGPDSGSFVSNSARSGISDALRLHTGLLQVPLSDIVDIRVVLEGYATRSAAERAQPDDVERLRGLIAVALEAENLTEFHELDTGFHVELARASGNALLPVMMEALRSVVKRAMLVGWDQLEDWRPTRDQLVNEHIAIVDKIEAGDADGAAAAVCTHVVNFYRDVVEPSR